MHAPKVHCICHAELNNFDIIDSAKHGVSTCNDLQFSQPWKCSSAVASAVHSALPDGALRLQEHAPGSALNDSPCAGKYLFTRLQSGENYRCFPKVSD